MEDAYEIGITLALENGVSDGLAVITRELRSLDGAIEETTQRLARLTDQARVAFTSGQRAASVGYRPTFPAGVQLTTLHAAGGTQETAAAEPEPATTVMTQPAAPPRSDAESQPPRGTDNRSSAPASPEPADRPVQPRPSEGGASIEQPQPSQIRQASAAPRTREQPPEFATANPPEAVTRTTVSPQTPAVQGGQKRGATPLVPSPVSTAAPFAPAPTVSGSASIVPNVSVLPRPDLRDPHRMPSRGDEELPAVRASATAAERRRRAPDVPNAASPLPGEGVTDKISRAAPDVGAAQREPSPVAAKPVLRASAAAPGPATFGRTEPPRPEVAQRDAHPPRERGPLSPPFGPAPPIAARQETASHVVDVPGPWRPGAAAPPPPQRQDDGIGAVHLDGALVGHWIVERLARQAARPPAGPTGFDPRLTPTWFPGAL